MASRLEEMYAIFDLTPDASEAEVRAARLVMLKVWHPDRHESDPALRRKAEAKTKAINEAFGLLERAGFPRGDGNGEATSNAPPPRAPKTPHPPPTAPASNREREPAEPQATPAAPAPNEPASTGNRPTTTLVVTAAALGLGVIGIVAAVSANNEGSRAEGDSGYAAARSHSPSEYSSRPPAVDRLSSSTGAPAPGDPGRTFSLRSTEAEVIASEGTPDKITKVGGETWWYYAASRVEFRGGRVVAWESSPSRPLRVHLTPTSLDVAAVAKARNFFTVGSSTDEVLAVEGVPDQIDPFMGSEVWWYYGPSRIVFRRGKVTEWDSNLRRPLKVRVGEKPIAVVSAAKNERTQRPTGIDPPRVPKRRLANLEEARRNIRRIIAHCGGANAHAYLKLRADSSGMVSMASVSGQVDNSCAESAIKTILFPETPNGLALAEEIGAPSAAKPDRVRAAGGSPPTRSGLRLNSIDEARRQIRRIITRCSGPNTKVYLKLRTEPSGLVSMAGASGDVDGNCVESAIKTLVFPKSSNGFSLDEEIAN